MILATDIESGNGKNIREIAKDHFQMELDGDTPGYADYFHVKLIEDQSRNTMVTLDLLPDSKFADFYSEHGGYDVAFAHVGEAVNTPDLIIIDRTFFDPKGSPIWCKRRGDWVRHPPDLHSPLNGSMRVLVPMEGGEEVNLCSNVPLLYSQNVKWMEEAFQSNRAISRLEILGQSVQGRNIYCFEITDPSHVKKKGNIVFLSGSHGIEFPGQWATRGILEYLLSPDPFAKWVREKYVVHIIIHSNPDGTVMGRPQVNVEGINIHSDIEMKSREANVLWKHLSTCEPIIYMEFHGWRCCERGHEPFEGSYGVSVLEHKTDIGRLTKTILDKELVRKTFAISRYECIVESEFFPGYNLTKEFDTVSYVYEPNMRVGVEGCKARGVQVLKVLLNGIEIVKTKTMK
ncbi:MAG: M14 family zinc carboxypeptidase [Thermoproteota archaeon]